MRMFRIFNLRTNYTTVATNPYFSRINSNVVHKLGSS